MKLVGFKNLQGYWFILNFENGESKEIDLTALIAKYVDLESINTAKVNQEWGCLEFNDGMVDIEPKTLYRFTLQHAREIQHDRH